MTTTSAFAGSGKGFTELVNNWAPFFDSIDEADAFVLDRMATVNTKISAHWEPRTSELIYNVGLNAEEVQAEFESAFEDAFSEEAAFAWISKT
jgi:hypothetical protein